ncbi:hypothetical protein CJD38_11370 [Stenotrophobium rhamnosiphilum]|uniref:TonB-dependent receptor n=2 Tax=Stenotrophobium rhamnosiphilum TaxID=2029166 RepID=A0A2T5ME88_9GAMM|nr:hypothetical protein CJD38_11370 [Stenotrophobium rhamnosiphilum]
MTALKIGLCMLVAMPMHATAQEQPSQSPAAQNGEASQNELFDELLSSTEPSAPTQTEEPVATPEPATSAAQPDPTATAIDEVLPTIAAPQKSESTQALKAPPSHAQIEEVVVTATKRAENVRDIPASITALSGEELEQRGAQDTADIVKLVPGVNLTSTGDSPARVTIRGIASDIGTSSTTGILFGNVSFSDGYAPILSLDPNPFDMASVEVLKGPQGTLFGASALNGAVRYVPTLPRFGQYEVKWFGQYTSIKEGDAAPTYGAAVNLPLYEDSLALRVMAFDRIAPGFIDNTRIPKKDTNQTDQKGARALLGWHPSEAWDVLLTTAYQQTKLQDVGTADNDQGRLVTNDRARVSPNTTKYWMGDFSVTYSGEWAQFVSDTSYIYKAGNNFFDATSRTAGKNPPLSLIAQQYTGDSDTFGQEFRLVSVDNPDSSWKWVTGVFAWQQSLRNKLTVPLAIDVAPLATILDALSLTPLSSLFSETGSPIVVQTAADVRIRELALFGDLTRRLGDSVEIALGGRLYRTSSGGQNVQSGVYVLAQQGSSPYVVEGEVKEKGFSPKASITWHINEDILAYGLVSKGFRVGGIQTGLTSSIIPSTSPKIFKSDTLWNYEAGLRTQFLDNTLRVDLTGFMVDWKNPQSLQPDASGLTVFITNVGGVKSRGGDLSVQYLFPWQGLMFTTAVSYADTVTTKDFTTATGDVYPVGTTWPLAPKWQTSSNLSFMRPIGDWTVGGFATYTTLGSAVPVFGGHKVFGYKQVDLQLSVSNEQYKWLPQIALIVNNLTDERGLTNAFTSGIPTPELAAEEYYYITPRALTLRLSGRFGD